MALIDNVRATCTALAGLGWRKLMLTVTHGGLDITALDLEAELLKPLENIDRSIPGFEDFSLEGVRAIEPGQPARSLLYHALASPPVSGLPGEPPVRGYPSLAQLESVENYVYGAVPPGPARLPGASRPLRPVPGDPAPGRRRLHPAVVHSWR